MSENGNGQEPRAPHAYLANIIAEVAAKANQVKEATKPALESKEAHHNPGCSRGLKPPVSSRLLAM